MDGTPDGWSEGYEDGRIDAGCVVVGVEEGWTEGNKDCPASEGKEDKVADGLEEPCEGLSLGAALILGVWLGLEEVEGSRLGLSESTVGDLKSVV